MATILVNSGKLILVNLLRGVGSVPKYIGWGTSTQAASSTDIGLGSPSSEARVTGSLHTTQSIVSGAFDTWTVVGLITTLSNQIISEVACFDAITSGNLFIHSVFTGISLLTGDQITITIGSTFS